MYKVKTNPFKPTAGAKPPVLAGRTRVIEDFTDGLIEGPGAPGRLMKITGSRGSGKTVLLNELEDIARDKGWMVIDETAQTGRATLVERIIAALLHAAADMNTSAEVNLGIVKGKVNIHEETTPPNLRDTLTAASQRASSAGVMVTIDEAQDADRNDMLEIATSVQHLIREGRNVIFVFAGITTGILDFVNDSTMAFLRRAKSEELTAISIDEVSSALQKSFESGGLHIHGEALQQAAEATNGYAFLIQLVGYYVWRAARKHSDNSPTVTLNDVIVGIKNAYDEYDNAVIAPALSGISERSLRYLIAMAQIGDSVPSSKIAEALNVPATSLTSARRTLISQQIIESPVRGRVVFAIPRLREYLNRNAEELLTLYE